MFKKTKKSLLKEIEREDPELAVILVKINRLLYLTTLKLRWVQSLLIQYNSKKWRFHHDKKTLKYLEENKLLIDEIVEIISQEKSIKKGEKKHKRIFKEEIEDMNEAIDVLKKLRRYVIRESSILKSLGDLHANSRWYRALSICAKMVKKEIDLIRIESQKIVEIDRHLRILDNRIEKFRKLPFVTSKYYHASPYIFNVGDVVRESQPRLDPGGKFSKVEDIFERIRRDEFPTRPSRFKAIFVDTDPRVIESFGLVYAVKVEGKVFRTDQEQFTEARIALDRWKDLKEAESRARVYWSGGNWLSIPEVIVNGKVTILGVADYAKTGDKIQIMVDGLEDDEGQPISKGAKGVIDYFDKYEEDLPFSVTLEDKREVDLPAGVFKTLR